MHLRNLRVNVEAGDADTAEVNSGPSIDSGVALA